MAKSVNNWGFKLLGGWLILQGLSQLFDLHFEGFYVVMGILALASGILILVNR